jgi:hypothetical protein
LGDLAKLTIDNFVDSCGSRFLEFYKIDKKSRLIKCVKRKYPCAEFAIFWFLSEFYFKFTGYDKCSTKTCESKQLYIRPGLIGENLPFHSFGTLLRISCSVKNIDLMSEYYVGRSDVRIKRVSQTNYMNLRLLLSPSFMIKTRWNNISSIEQLSSLTCLFWKS